MMIHCVQYLSIQWRLPSTKYRTPCMVLFIMYSMSSGHADFFVDTKIDFPLKTSNGIRRQQTNAFDLHVERVPLHHYRCSRCLFVFFLFSSVPVIFDSRPLPISPHPPTDGWKNEMVSGNGARMVRTQMNGNTHEISMPSGR